MVEEFSKAIALAVRAHKGHYNKFNGEPYLLHVLRVIGNTTKLCAKLNIANPDAYQAVAALHDTVEDTTVCIGDFYIEGFSNDVIFAVDAITHPKAEPYDEYINRIMENKIATVVKLADLLDHLDRPEPKPGMHKKYRKAYDLLLKGASLYGPSGDSSTVHGE